MASFCAFIRLFLFPIPIPTTHRIIAPIPLIDFIEQRVGIAILQSVIEQIRTLRIVFSEEFPHEDSSRVIRREIWGNPIISTEQTENPLTLTERHIDRIMVIPITMNQHEKRAGPRKISPLWLRGLYADYLARILREVRLAVAPPFRTTENSVRLPRRTRKRADDFSIVMLRLH